MWCPHTDSNREPIDYKSAKSKSISFYYAGYETLIKDHFYK